MPPTAPNERGRRVGPGSMIPTPTTGAGTAPSSVDDEMTLPGFLRVLLLVLLSACLAYAIVVTPLALVNQFAEGPVLLSTAVLTVVIAAAWLRTLAPGGKAGPGISTAIGLVTIVGVTALNLRYSSQNVVQDRDPGAYNVSARWFASHHTFFFDGLKGAFAAHHELTVAGAGFRGGAPGGQVYPQFLHVLPAFLSAAYWIGGNSLLFKGNALIGGIALLAFYAFARTWLREGLAAVAVVMLAINVVQIIHTRNTYSEILSQVFLFGGLWALVEADRAASLRTRAAGAGAGYLVAGLLLGATGMVRIDGFVYLIPIAIVATVRLWQAESMDPSAARRARRAVAVFSVGVAITTALGVIDGLRFSRPYFDDNKALLLEVFAGLALTVGGCAVALYVHRRRGRPLLSRRMIDVLGVVAVALILVVVAWAWFIRPYAGNVSERLRPSGGISDLRTTTLPHKILIRTFAERTIPRLALFVGFTTLAAGFVGFALLIRRLLKNPADPRLAFVMIFGVTTTLYVYRPSIASDMIWFLRRFLPVTIPGLILFSLVVVEMLLRLRRPTANAVTAVIVLAGLAWSIALLPPHIVKRTYSPLLPGVTGACRRLGPDSAVVIVQSTNVAEGPQYRYPQALQAFCEVPVATAPPNLTPSFYRTLAAEWHARGRRLLLVSDDPRFIQPAGTTKPQILQATRYEVLEHTLNTIPTHYVQRLLLLFVEPVPAG
jgi:hypothetical protein